MEPLALSDKSGREAKISLVRDVALKDLEGMLQEAVDKVRADGKASDYIALVAQLSKIAGVDQEKKDKYDGLKMVNIVIGSNMSIAATVDSIPISEPKDTLVTDVQAKPAKPVLVDDEPDIDPDNPDGDAQASQALMDSFALLGSSMVLPDD